MTVLLIASNIIAFFYELSMGTRLEQFIFEFGVVPSVIQHTARFPVAVAADLARSILFSMFLHAGWFHLISNMWYLWIFGDNVEDRMGHVRFLLFYLLSGTLASLTHIAFNPASNLPSIGASGAVAGVLGAYLVTYPFARVLTVVPMLFLWPIVELPALLVLGMWFIVQLLNGSAAIATTEQTVGGIAWFAHIGGFLAGIVLLSFFKKRRVALSHF